jgi:uncharacterized protein involved in exopolysaccharide biosynthesis
MARGCIKMDMKTIDLSVEQSARKLFHPLLRHKLLFAATTIVVFAVVMLGALALTPTYQSITFLLTRSGAEAPTVSSGGASKAEGYTPPRTLVQIAESDDVIRQAATDVGIDRLVPHAESRPSVFLWLRSKIFAVPIPTADTSEDSWLGRVKLALDIRAEPNSDVISIAYRNRDPAVAREFVAAMAQRFMDKQIALYSRPGAADFFRQQKQRFDDAYRHASEQLAQFSIGSGTYDAEEQRKLLLKRASDLSADYVVSQGNASQQLAERQSLGTQLHLLAPVARSPWVSALVNGLAGGTPPAADSTLRNDASDPPLLLVRVYQDSMAALFKLNSQIAGDISLQAHQAHELAGLTGNLNDLITNEQKYFQLKRDADQAADNADTYSKRMAEEEIAAAYIGSIHSIKLIQSASVPTAPVFPNYKLMTVGAFIISLVFAAGITLLRANLLTTRVKRRYSH